MEFEGKTVEEAIALGLKEMNLTEENATVKIIEEPQKGLFGKTKGKAVVSIEEKNHKEKKENNETLDLFKTSEFVEKVFEFMGISAKASVDTEKAEPTINVVAEKSSEIIGYRGEVLDSIQTLASAFANIGKEDYKKVTVDCENYRNRREETLVSLAHKLEAKATELRRKVMLEAMNPFERRIIHTALSGSQTVTTKSEGKEPNRYVIIVPNDLDEFSTPYNAGRNNNKGHDRKGRNELKKYGDRKGNGFGSKKKDRLSGFAEEMKRKANKSFGFGTYLGNSLKGDEEKF